jgi:hypothetical protein
MEPIGYEMTPPKGAIRFDTAKPLPATLVRKLVKARQARTPPRSDPRRRRR